LGDFSFVPVAGTGKSRRAVPNGCRRLDEGVPLPTFWTTAQPLGFFMAAGSTFKDTRTLFLHRRPLYHIGMKYGRLLPFISRLSQSDRWSATSRTNYYPDSYENVVLFPREIVSHNEAQGIEAEIPPCFMRGIVLSGLHMIKKHICRE
jgi:hypothetical protein